VLENFGISRGSDDRTSTARNYVAHVTLCSAWLFLEVRCKRDLPWAKSQDQIHCYTSSSFSAASQFSTTVAGADLQHKDLVRSEFCSPPLIRYAESEL
jgi:hypothetical protein